MTLTATPASPPSPPQRAVQFGVAWERRSGHFWSDFRAIFAGPKPRKEWRPALFRDSRIQSRLPGRAIFASTLWHLVLVAWILVFPKLPGPRGRLLPPRIEVTWYGSVHDLKPLVIPGPLAKPSPPGEPRKPLPPRGTDAFHPRQTILSVPLRPTHPHQTLIQPEAPPRPPKILPLLPNVVEWTKNSQPMRPRLPISRGVLAWLRPKRVLRQTPQQVPVPELPNRETQPGELNIASTPVANQQPKMPVNPSAVAAPRAPTSAPEPVPVPQIGNAPANADAGLQRVIALSATPGPSAPTMPPGNVAARVTISPEGTQPGVPGGASNGPPNASGSAGGGPGGTGSAGQGFPGLPGISVTGGNPNATSAASGVGTIRTGSPIMAAPLPSKPEPRFVAVMPQQRPPESASGQLRPGESPENVLGTRQVYTLYINMPNLTSATGSWVLNFAELDEGSTAPRVNASDTGQANLVGPMPLRKVDPKYPPALISGHIEGEVILYAIIRTGGSVDSIRVVKGVDPQLDKNAMEALVQWRFRPALRNGQPVELEAVVHIPFRSSASF